MARQFALLERLGAVTIVLAETLGAEAAKYPGSSAAEAFTQVSRALRQTVALEMRLDAEREARARRDAEARREAETRHEPATARRAVASKTALGKAADDAASDDVAPDDAASDDDGQQDQSKRGAADDAKAATPREDLLRDLREQLDTIDELRGRPSGEVVARICRMLGIEADLRCFTDQEMGRLAGLNHAKLAKPPARLSAAEFEAALGRPSHGPPTAHGSEVSPNARLLAVEAAARDVARAGGGHDPPG